MLIADLLTDAKMHYERPRYALTAQEWRSFPYESREELKTWADILVPPDALFGLEMRASHIPNMLMFWSNS